MVRNDFSRKLRELEVVKFGKFTLKSGITSPFYLDLRQLLKDPVFMDQVTDALAEKAKNLDFDVVAGIPYTAVPLASLLAVKLGKPLVIPRKEVKTYGTGGNVMGHFEKGQTCLVVDDLITTGSSKIDTANVLEAEGLKVKDFLVIFDRRGESENDELAQAGYGLSTLYTLNDVVAGLKEEKLLTAEQEGDIHAFIHGGQKAAEEAIKEETQEPQKPHPLAQRLLDLMAEKQSNLVLSLDVTTRKEFFGILEEVGPKIVLLKTHVDILDDFTPDFIEELQTAAKKHNFLIFEDRKFADIGNTVKHQYRDGVYKIHDWADFVTVHMVAGPGTLEGLFQGTENRGGFVLARMSSQGNFITPEYTARAFEAGKNRREWVAGYIGHGKDAADIAAFKSQMPEGQLLLMPGVKLQEGSDNLGQRYLSAEEAITGGADLLIMGRGIIKAESPGKTAEEVKDLAWKSYQKRIQEEAK